MTSFRARGVSRTAASFYVRLCVTATIIDQVVLLGEVSIKLRV